jgi:predicted HTH transcriptional regulator
MMIRESLAHALPEPDFAQRGGEFTITIWRDWLTDAVMDELGLNERQRKAIAFVKTNGRITNKEYQGALAVSKPPASRDLELLRRIKVFTKVGSTGKGTYYVLSRGGLTTGSMGSSVCEVAAHRMRQKCAKRAMGQRGNQPDMNPTNPT